MLPEDEQYLLSRGYTQQMIAYECPKSVPAGRVVIHETELSLPSKGIAFELLSAAQTRFGYHVVLRDHNPKYMNFMNDNLPWIPAVYGTPRDFEIAHKTGELIIVEGLFDRAVFTQLFPNRACIARLSKGMTKKLQNYISRFIKTLYVAYDMDEAGQQGWYSTRKRLHPDVWCTKIEYPAYDPSDLLQKFGSERTKTLLEKQF